MASKGKRKDDSIQRGYLKKWAKRKLADSDYLADRTAGEVLEDLISLLKTAPTRLKKPGGIGKR